MDGTHAERQRRYRERNRLPLKQRPRFALVAVPYDLVIGLIERGFLADGASLDPNQRGEALVKFAQEMIKKRDAYSSARSM